jgi:hypothetical protein
MKKSLTGRGAVAFLIVVSSVAISSTALTPTAHAEPTPAPTSNPTIDSYKASLEQFKVNREIYLAAMRERSQQIRVINIAFKSACDKAAQDFRIAMSASKSPDQKNLANASRKNAISAAIVARDAAISALGAEPIAPIEPMKPAKVSGKNKSR